MSTEKEKHKMSTGKAIFTIIMFVFRVGVPIYFAWYLYGQLVIGPSEDARYEAHGCYISDGGSMYTCPNGLPHEK